MSTLCEDGGYRFLVGRRQMPTRRARSERPGPSTAVEALGGRLVDPELGDRHGRDHPGQARFHLR
jgi:hypothetical protein